MFELDSRCESLDKSWEVCFIGDCREIYNNARTQFEGEIYLGKKFEFKMYNEYDEFIDKIGRYSPPIVFLCDNFLKSGELVFAAIDIIKSIREDLENSSTRIILVTDEGPIDVKEHILRYDINDIRKPEDLMGIKLYTTIISSIRTYDGLIKLINSESELKKAKYRATESLKFKSRFLAKMSHEIRTPLNGMIITSQLLSESNLSEIQGEYVEIIKKSTNRLMPIINDIIDLSKIEYGKLRIKTEKMNLEEEIIDTVCNMKYHAKSKGIKLEYYIDNNISRNLIGDKNRLRQVLINLLNNSIKFTEKGYISVRCLLLDEEDESQNIRFEVEDTGVGIHKDEVETIFDVFVQTEIGCNIGGSGLGLSICKELIELMGGTIKVDSYHGIGSKFYFELKFEKNIEEIEAKNSFTKIYNPRFKKAKILVADDDYLSRRVISEILMREGMEVEMAENGYDVLEILDENDFSMVLMDIAMPELDGLETTSIIRNGFNNIKKDIPIIAVSANASRDDFKKAIDHGLDGYITKPLDQNELLEVLSKYY